MIKEAPEGQLFSRTYLERGLPVRDSNRFRNRLLAYLYQKHSDDIYRHLDKAIKVELGVAVPSTHGVSDFEAYFSKAEIRDILDTISLMVCILREKGNNSGAEQFVSFVQRVFEEENLGYRVDSKGGVHYFIDEEFERNRVSALAALTSAKYAGVAKALESAFSALDSRSVNAKTAVPDPGSSLVF